jgi:hypothetical protein
VSVSTPDPRLKEPAEALKPVIEDGIVTRHSDSLCSKFAISPARDKLNPDVKLVCTCLYHFSASN